MPPGKRRSVVSVIDAADTDNSGSPGQPSSTTSLKGTPGRRRSSGTSATILDVGSPGTIDVDEAFGDVLTETITDDTIDDIGESIVQLPIRNERFAQLLAMRDKRRTEVMTKHALDDGDDGLSSFPQSPTGKLNRKSLSSSSFAALPMSAQHIRKILASIDVAQEEAKAEESRRATEAALAREMETRHHHYHSDGSDGLEERVRWLDVKKVVSALTSSEPPTGSGNITKSPSGTPLQAAASLSAGEDPSSASFGARSSAWNEQQLQRVMSPVDLALRHKIRVYASDTSGIDPLCALVSGREAGLIPSHQLLIPDEPPSYDLPDLALQNKPGSKGGKKGARKAPPKRSNAAAGGVGGDTHGDTAALGTRGQRIAIDDMMRSYDDHRLVVGRAISYIKDHGGPKLDEQLMQRLAEREASRYCEPIPGVRTVLYFPSKRDTETTLAEKQRVDVLSACTRKGYGSGLVLHPTVLESITSQASGCLAFQSTRRFHSTLSYEVVISPRRLYINLERMCRRLVSPAALRKIVYLCFGDRSLKELAVWQVILAKYEDAKKRRSLRQWLERFQKQFGKHKTTAGKRPSTAEAGDEILDPDVCAALDDLVGSLGPFDDEPASLGVADRETQTIVDDGGPCGSFSWAWQHPYGAVDWVVEQVLDAEWHAFATASSSKPSSSASTLPPPPQRFSEWFHRTRKPVAEVMRRFNQFLLRNTAEMQLLDAYLLLLPQEVSTRRHAFEEAKRSGFIPSCDVWVPPNLSTKSLEELENAYSAKASSQRDAAVWMQYLSMFRTTYHPALSLWIGEPRSRSGEVPDPWVSLGDYVNFLRGKSVAAAGSSARKGRQQRAAQDGGQAPPSRALIFQAPSADLFTVITEEMHPQWPPVEGWPEPDFGGFAARGNAANLPKPKRRGKGGSQSTTVAGGMMLARERTPITLEVEPLESIGDVFAPTAATRCGGGSANATPSKKKNPLPGRDDINASSDDDEQREEDAAMATMGGMDKKVSPHERYRDWDGWMLYHGQGLYFEAFISMLRTSPPFARDALGLVLRVAYHFQSLS